MVLTSFPKEICEHQLQQRAKLGVENQAKMTRKAKKKTNRKRVWMMRRTWLPCLH